MAGLPEDLKALEEPEAYPHPVSGVRLLETPISWVLLTGDVAYKIKRPVRLPFVDLTSRDHRRHLCFEELRLNRRFAPELYLGVSAITRTPSGVRIAGRGEVVEHAVRMRQFDPAQSLATLLEAGEADAASLAEFGASIAAIHETLPRTFEPGVLGDPDRARAAAAENFRQCRDLAATAGLVEDFTSLREAFDVRQGSLQAVLHERWRRGRVRECHGDLHAGNVVRWRSRLLAFDCMEFEPAFRWIDVGLETAFLAMDLEARGSSALALAFLRGYVDRSGDYGQLRCLPLHGADRALVRAKVSILESRDVDEPQARAAALGRAMNYLRLARRFLAEPSRRQRLILMHGISGSGKSWLGSALAERLPALHLRSDIVRRQLVLPGRDAYSKEATLRTYELLAASAGDALAGGLDVIVDATFLHRENRIDFRRLAAVQGAALHVIDCHAPEATLRQRIASRAEKGGDPSEATTQVMARQLAQQEPIDLDEGLDVLAADTTRPDVLERVLAQLASE